MSSREGGGISIIGNSEGGKGYYWYWVKVKDGYVGPHKTRTGAAQSYRMLPRDYELKIIRKKKGYMWANKKWMTGEEWAAWKPDEQ